MLNTELKYEVVAFGTSVVDRTLFHSTNMSEYLQPGTCDRCGGPIDEDCGHEIIDHVERLPEQALDRAQYSTYSICVGCCYDFRTWMNPNESTLELFASVR